MRRAFLGLLLAAPAWAQTSPTPRTAPPTRDAPARRREEIDRLFAALATAPDEAGAALVEGRIRALWQEDVTPAVGLLVRRGLRNLAGRAAEEALEDFDAAITLEPSVAELWHLRAQAHLLGGEQVAAARDLREALRLEPRHFPALSTLASLLERRGDAAGALAALRAALALHPRLPGGAARLRDLIRKAEGDAT